jgi:diaminopimelate epimerase
MNLHFYKYQGTGNDFVLIDNREAHFKNDAATVARLCDRKFGVGADGLILLENIDGVKTDSNIKNNSHFDFKMVYFNADGNESSMCGNGGRCLVAFAKFLKIQPKNGNIYQFLAIDGAHEALVNADETVELKMQNVANVTMDGMDYVLNTGSPHFVRMAYDAEKVDVFTEGKKVRNSETYKNEGINVNFVSRIDKNTIKVTTYERGVEDETLSCGTGVTAAAIASYLQQKLAAKQWIDYGNITDPQTTNVRTKGGNLQVRFQMEADGSFTDVWLCGAAEMVFEGFL